MKKHLILNLASSLALSVLAIAGESKDTSLFDGKTLTGWKPLQAHNAKYWSVQNGVIVASNGSQPMPSNSYLVSAKSYKDFIFTCKFRITGDPKTGFINAGIQYRSITKEGKIIGYQADIGSGYWGDIYDEHRRGSLVKGNAAELFKTFKENEWGSYKIICKGNKHQLYINDVLMADYTEQDASIPAEGVFALQIHSGGAAKVEYKDISIQEL